MNEIIVCTFIFILLIPLVPFVICSWNKKKDYSRKLLGSIKPKGEGTDVNELIKFLKEHPNIKYNINRSKNND